MPRPKIYDNALKQRLLAAAGRVVTERGLDALTLRRISADAGTSTSAVYALIGGRDEVIRELFLDAYRSFGAAQLAVAMAGDPATDLRALAVAYRTWALANPYLYQVMFGGVLGEVELTDGQRQECGATIEPLRSTVAAGLRAGTLSGGSEDELTIGFWALVHGLSSLELTTNDALPSDARAAVFDAAVAALIRGWQPTT